MRIINILGAFILFVPIFFRYKSKRALIVFINGVIFHCDENNEYLRYYDIVCNTLMCYYTYHEYKPSLKYTLFSCSNFFINNYLYQNTYLSRTHSDIYHVLFIQTPLAIGLSEVKEIQY